MAMRQNTNNVIREDSNIKILIVKRRFNSLGIFRGNEKKKNQKRKNTKVMRARTLLSYRYIERWQSQLTLQVSEPLDSLDL